MDHIKQKKKFLPRKSPFPSLGLAGATPQFGWAASRPPASYLSFPGDTGRAGQTQTCITAPLASHGTLSLLHPGQATAAQPGCAGLTPQAEVSPRRGLMASSLGMSWVPSWTHLDLCRSYGAWLWLALTLQTALVRAGNSLHPLRTQPPAASRGPRAAPETTGTRKKSQPLHYFFCCFIPPVRCLCRSWPTASGFGRSTRGHHQMFSGAGAGFPHQRATFQRKGCREHRRKQQKPLSFWLCSGSHSKDERQTWALQRLN